MRIEVLLVAPFIYCPDDEVPKPGQEKVEEEFNKTMRALKRVIQYGEKLSRSEHHSDCKRVISI